MRRRRILGRGFTLAELMAVVVIVAVLATLAVVAYRTLLRTARSTEAVNLVGSIRARQEQFHQDTPEAHPTTYATTGDVLNCVNGSLTGCCPAITSLGNRKVGWNPACGTPITMEQLHVDSDGPVYFGYATTGYLSTAAPPGMSITNGSAVETITWPSTITQNYYVVSAIGDPDGSGDPCHVVTSSFTNQIFMDSNCK
jgi:prepilin-type N-terminal cleavage/methylation domain-containing protein